MFWCSSVPLFLCSGPLCSSVPFSGAPVFQRSGILVFQRSIVLVFYSSILILHVLLFQCSRISQFCSVSVIKALVLQNSGIPRPQCSAVLVFHILMFSVPCLVFWFSTVPTSHVPDVLLPMFPVSGFLCFSALIFSVPLFQCPSILVFCVLSSPSLPRFKGSLVFQCSNIPVYQCSNVPCASVPKFQCINVPMFLRINVPVFQYSGVSMFYVPMFLKTKKRLR